MLPKLTILITGANGQLGLQIKLLSVSMPEYNYIFAEKSILQIEDKAQVDIFFSKNKIDICVNCAAYTAVDKAEQNKELALAVNTNAVGNLAKVCKQYGVKFIHLSTDYVFNGKAKIPYKETDVPEPVNFYGSTKLGGEQLAQLYNEQCIIIRTAWVYSMYGANFVKTMLRLLHEKESIQVVNDQYGSPTYAADLAHAIFSIIGSNIFVPGIYHFSNSGTITWYQFANQIALVTKSTCKVEPITTAQYYTPAARPAFSVLDTSLIQSTFNITISPWMDSLHKCIETIRL